MRLTTIAYLASYTLSLLGNSIASIALPLIILHTTGSALSAGIVAAATAIPAVLAGLFMGVVIDRINRRTSSVLTDLISAAAIGMLPLVDMISGLNLGWFVILGMFSALGDVPGQTAREALLPAIVRNSTLSSERLVGLREGAGALALLVGPAIAGTLMALFDGSTVLWVTAATSFAAALNTLLIPHRAGAIPATEENTTVGNGWSQLRHGWRVLFRTRFLFIVTVLSLASAIVMSGLQGLILPVHFILLDQPSLLGFVLSSMAAGVLVGAGCYSVLGQRGSRRTWFVLGLTGVMIGFAVIASLVTVWMIFAGGFLVGLSSGVFSSLLGVLMIERIPEYMRGRIMGTQNSILTAAPAAGVMFAAVLTEQFSVAVAAIAVAGIWLLVMLFALFEPALRNLDAALAQDAD